MTVEPKDIDGDIAAQLRQGEATAIGRLYDRYGRLAYGLALRVLNDRTAAEDVVQEAFLGIWRNAGSFDTSRGTVRNWLLSIVHNRAIDRVRGTARIRREARLEAMRARGGRSGTDQNTVAPRAHRRGGSAFTRVAPADHAGRRGRPCR